MAIVVGFCVHCNIKFCTLLGVCVCVRVHFVCGCLPLYVFQCIIIKCRNIKNQIVVIYNHVGMLQMKYCCCLLCEERWNQNLRQANAKANLKPWLNGALGWSANPYVRKAISVSPSIVFVSIILCPAALQRPGHGGLRTIFVPTGKHLANCFGAPRTQPSSHHFHDNYIRPIKRWPAHQKPRQPTQCWRRCVANATTLNGDLAIFQR